MYNSIIRVTMIVRIIAITILGFCFSSAKETKIVLTQIISNNIFICRHWLCYNGARGAMAPSLLSCFSVASMSWFTLAIVSIIIMLWPPHLLTASSESKGRPLLRKTASSFYAEIT